MIYVGEREFDTVEEAQEYLRIKRELTYGKKYDIPDSTIQAKTGSNGLFREPILGSTRWFRERGLLPQREVVGDTVDTGSEPVGEDSK